MECLYLVEEMTSISNHPKKLDDAKKETKASRCDPRLWHSPPPRAGRLGAEFATTAACGGQAPGMSQSRTAQAPLEESHSAGRSARRFSLPPVCGPRPVRECDPHPAPKRFRLRPARHG